MRPKSDDTDRLRKMAVATSLVNRVTNAFTSLLPTFEMDPDATPSPSASIRHAQNPSTSPHPSPPAIPDCSTSLLPTPTSPPTPSPSPAQQPNPPSHPKTPPHSTPLLRPLPPTPASHLRAARSTLRAAITSNPRFKHPDGALHTQWVYRVAALETDAEGVLVGERGEVPGRVNVGWKTVGEMEGEGERRKKGKGGSGLRWEFGGRGRKVGGGKEGMGKRRVGGTGMERGEETETNTETRTETRKETETRSETRSDTETETATETDTATELEGDGESKRNGKGNEGREKDKDKKENSPRAKKA